MTSLATEETCIFDKPPPSPVKRPVVAIIPPAALVIPVEEWMLPKISRFAVGVFPIPTFLSVALTNRAFVLTVRFPSMLALAALNPALERVLEKVPEVP